MDHGDKRHIRLFVKGEAQAERAMGGQVADEKVRQRLTRVSGVLVVRLGFGILAVSLADDFAILRDAHTLHVLRSRGLVFGADEASFDSGRAVMVQDDIAEFGFAKAEIAEAEQTVGVFGISFGEKPGGASVRCEELDDGRGSMSSPAALRAPLAMSRA